MRFCTIGSRTRKKLVWAVLDSNQRPPQCQCDALPAALTAQTNYSIFNNAGSAALFSKSQAKRSLSALTAQTNYSIFNNAGSAALFLKVAS